MEVIIEYTKLVASDFRHVDHAHPLARRLERVNEPPSIERNVTSPSRSALGAGDLAGSGLGLGTPTRCTKVSLAETVWQ